MAYTTRLFRVQLLIPQCPTISDAIIPNVPSSRRRTAPPQLEVATPLVPWVLSPPSGEAGRRWRVEHRAPYPAGTARALPAARRAGGIDADACNWRIMGRRGAVVAIVLTLGQQTNAKQTTTTTGVFPRRAAAPLPHLQRTCPYGWLSAQQR